MEIDYKKFAQIFSERTRINLDIITQMADAGGDVYEVTQLLNSLFGITIVSYELFFRNNNLLKSYEKEHILDSTSGKELEKFIRDCEEKNILKCTYANWDHKGIELVRHIRNSMSHSGNSGISFFPLPEKGYSEPKDIKYVIFYDKNKSNRSACGDCEEEFCLLLSIDELRMLSYDIQNFFADISKLYGEKAARKYEMHYKKVHKLLPDNNIIKIG